MREQSDRDYIPLVVSFRIALDIRYLGPLDVPVAVLAGISQ